jgi:hypothetical protein
LVDRTFRINNNWFTFDKDIKDLTKTLCRNAFPPNLVEKVIRKYLNHKFQQGTTEDEAKEVLETRYFKLPYIGSHSTILKKKVMNVVKKFCDGIDVRLVFVSTKIKDSFSCKDSFQSFSHKSMVIYKFECTGCKSSYIGETERHLSVRIQEHFKNKTSHIFRHLQEFPNCKEVCDEKSFSVLDSGTTKHQLRIKEGLYIKWENPTLNKQVFHYNSALLV